MIMKTTIATVKNEFRLTEWSAQIQAQKSSGLTVHKWCEKKVSMLIPCT